MADKYTIQVNPQVSVSDAQKMENELNKIKTILVASFQADFKN